MSHDPRVMIINDSAYLAFNDNLEFSCRLDKQIDRMKAIGTRSLEPRVMIKHDVIYLGFNYNLEFYCRID